MENQDGIIKEHINRIKKEQNSLIKNALITNLETFLRTSNISEDVKRVAQELINKHHNVSSYVHVPRGDITDDPNCQEGKKGCVMQGGSKKRRSLNKRSKSRRSKKGGKKTKKRSKKN
tara:strand:- start:28 stop:381 length:354 start_codon:yes stop_codon:yes gene_type:complete